MPETVRMGSARGYEEGEHSSEREKGARDGTRKEGECEGGRKCTE